jgi:hypothetical protein
VHHHAAPTWRPALDRLALGRDQAAAVWLLSRLAPGARTVSLRPDEYQALTMRGGLRDLVAIEHKRDRVLVHVAGLLRRIECADRDAA